MTTLTGCPGEEDCNDALGGISRVDDLILLTPLQNTYNVGDVITFKISVPATNDYFYGETINLLQETNDHKPKITTAYDNLFIGNQLVFIKGSQGAYVNWFNLAYDDQTNLYELEIKITLNKIGNYILQTNDSVEFQGSSKCNRFRLDTNILHNEPGPGDFEFTVQ